MKGPIPMRARATFALAMFLAVPPPLVSHAALPPIQRVTLANGLRVVLAPDSLASGVDVAVWYPAGTRIERAGQTGITHLVERLEFRGSAKVGDGEHRARVVAAGGTLNTSASADHLSLWQTVPAEALALTLALEADRMAGLSPSPAAFEEERREALSDRARAERTPVARGLAQLWAEAFAGHPYARPITGLEDDVRSLTLADALRWQRERLAPGSAVLTVAGRFEPEAALERIRALFGRLPRGARQSAAAGVPAAGAVRRAEEQADVPVRILFAGYRGPGASDPATPAMELLAQILGTGESSQLMRILGQEWGVALAAQAGVDVRRDASLFWVFAAVRDEANAETTERVLRDELSRIAREGLDAEALERAKRQAETRILFAAQGVRARAHSLGEAELLRGDASLADRRLAELTAVTPAAVQAAAKRLFEGGAHAIVWMMPASSGGAR